MSGKSTIGGWAATIQQAIQEAEKKRREQERAQQRKRASATANAPTVANRSGESGRIQPRSQPARKATLKTPTAPSRVTPGVSGAIGQSSYTPIRRGWSDNLSTIGQGAKILQSAMNLPAKEDAISGKMRVSIGAKDETDAYASALLDGESTVSAYKQWMQVQMAPPGERRSVADLERDPGFRQMRKMLFPQIAAIIDGKSVPLTADQQILHSLYSPGSDEQTWEQQLRQQDRASGQPWQDEGTDLEKILEDQKAATGSTSIFKAQEELLRREQRIPKKQDLGALSTQQQQQAAQVAGRDMSILTEEEEQFRHKQHEQSRADQIAATEQVAQGNGDLSAKTAREINQKKRESQQKQVQEYNDRANGSGDFSVNQFHAAPLPPPPPKIRADTPGKWESLTAHQWAADTAAGNVLSEEDRQERLQGEYNQLMRRFKQGNFADMKQGQDGIEGEGALQNKLLKLVFDPAYTAFYQPGGVRENLEAQTNDASRNAMGQGDLSAGTGLDYARMGTPEYDANEAYYIQTFGVNGHRFGQGSRYLNGRDMFNRHNDRTLDDYLANEYAGYEYQALPSFIKDMIWWERMFADDSYGVNIGADAAISNQLKNTIALGIGIERTGVQFAESVVSIIDIPSAIVNWIGKSSGAMDPDTKTLLEDTIRQINDYDRYLQEELVPEGYGNVSSVTALVGNVVLDYLLDAGITKVADRFKKAKGIANAGDKITDLTKAADGATDLVKAADGATDLVKAADSATDLVKAADSATDLAKVTDRATDLVKVTDAAQRNRATAQALSEIAENVGGNELALNKALALPDSPYLGDIPISPPSGGARSSMMDWLFGPKKTLTDAEKIIRTKDAWMSFADGYSYAVEQGQDEQTRLLYGWAAAQANKVVANCFDFVSSTANNIGRKTLQRDVIVGLDQAVASYGPGIVPLFHSLAILTETGKTLLSDDRKERYYRVLDRFLAHKP